MSASGAAGPQKSERTALTGPGRVLVFVYGIFALAASARAAVQITSRFCDAPLAYSLTALAALIYLANTVLLARRSASSWRWAWGMCVAELIGVLGVGFLSIIIPEEFQDPTVWSQFGIGYGFVPVVLPVLGLWWLSHTKPGADSTHRAAR